MSRPALRRLLTLEEAVRTADTGGGRDETWQALGALWADVQAVSAREVFEGERPGARVTHRIIVRGAPVGAPSRPRPSQRFREGTRLFGIVAVSELDPMGRYLVCWAEEGRGL
ncbi:MAG TPA: head-tail adaptor protein [Paracoccaceae bacterium]|nr:head-tail adaptor protein [Paracoccaceae bacterium]